MTLQSLIASDIDAVFFSTDDFAVTAKYSSKDGTISSAAITAIFEGATDLAQTEYGAAIQDRIHIKESDVSRPAAYDEITNAAGLVWIVRQRIGGSGGVHVVLADADPRQIPRNVR